MQCCLDLSSFCSLMPKLGTSEGEARLDVCLQRNVTHLEAVAKLFAQLPGLTTDPALQSSVLESALPFAHKEMQMVAQLTSKRHPSFQVRKHISATTFTATGLCIQEHQ